VIRRLVCWLLSHDFTLRVTVDGVRSFACRCGATVPVIRRNEPVSIHPPAHERMTAQKAGR